MVTSSTGVLATGTYNKHIGLYDSESGEQICLMENTHRGGLTQLKFVQDNENYLLSGARKCNRLKVQLFSIPTCIFIEYFSVGI